MMTQNFLKGLNFLFKELLPNQFLARDKMQVPVDTGAYKRSEPLAVKTAFTYRRQFQCVPKKQFFYTFSTVVLSFHRSINTGNFDLLLKKSVWKKICRKKSFDRTSAVYPICCRSIKLAKTEILIRIMGRFRLALCCDDLVAV